MCVKIMKTNKGFLQTKVSLTIKPAQGKKYVDYREIIVPVKL